VCGGGQEFLQGWVMRWCVGCCKEDKRTDEVLR
jgi:hypothetical protein